LHGEELNCTYQLIVGTPGLKDLRLVFKGEVLPLKFGVDVLEEWGECASHLRAPMYQCCTHLLIEFKDLIMRSYAGVGEVVDSFASL